jgi:hypothetical protein
LLQNWPTNQKLKEKFGWIKKVIRRGQKIRRKNQRASWICEFSIILAFIPLNVNKGSNIY